MYDTFFVARNIHLFIYFYFYFLSDTFFKSFSSKYVYVEAATMTAVPSHVLGSLEVF
jgi:hypothetical protein